MWGFWKQERTCLVSGRRNKVEAAGLAAGIDTLALQVLGIRKITSCRSFFLVVLALFKDTPYCHMMNSLFEPIAYVPAGWL